MLLKNENQIIRVLKSHGNKALVIDCIKKTMPKWVDGNSLSNFDDCGEDEMFERTDYGAFEPVWFHKFCQCTNYAGSGCLAGEQ